MEFSDLYEMLVGEMSAPWIDYTNPSISANRKWKECEKDSKKIKGFISEQFGQVDVFLCSENDINKFFFFVGDNLWGTVETRLLKEGGIEMREIIKCVSLGLYMFDVFKDYFLENFSYVLSSEYHTKDGFSLYKRLAKDPSIKFTVIDNNTGQQIELKNSDDLNQYYGKGKHNYIYKIEKIQQKDE